MSDDGFYIGVDVGTGSARAGVFDHAGRMVGSGVHPIKIWRPEPAFVEQSTEDIWKACASAIRSSLEAASVPPEKIYGLGFDATCSLAAVDEQGRPVTVSLSGDDDRNVIVWMDHRATRQAEMINATQHEVLQYVGGRVSPEMQTPKLKWLKENLPDTWRRAAHFLDLADFLTFRATGSATRSLCTTVCKWTYLGHRSDEGAAASQGWASGFWKEIGLEDVVDEHYRRIGTSIRPMGEPAGEGLTAEAANDLGLPKGTPVGIGIIDAHAGGLGVLATKVGGESGSPGELNRRLALIGGTSSCHMAVAPNSRFIEGVWGPYYSAMIPGMWLNEGGQSATGALIDHVIASHARASELQADADGRGLTVYELLNGVLDDLSAKGKTEFPALLTADRHVLPYFHGNRSPRADSTLTGVMTGLRLSDDIEELALRYGATVQGIAYGTRHIIETMNAAGYSIDTLIATGGGSKNPLFLREHADITGCRVVVPREPEAVLLGAAMLGAVAGGTYPSIPDAMNGMSGPGEVIEPAGGHVAAYHDVKYEIFLRLYDDTQEYREIVANGMGQLSPDVNA